ncbi:MAG TPA: flavin reductase family protein [Bryobacteraceae bacterium]|jgi:flavin reductase (DIM6/NTAB) family NADH-FMN oxidoreductase RutF|nr:flavin reductase family protein [Bryobacteraceae bacterium]
MDPQVRRKTLRMFSNGVYIITSAAGGRFGGATVTWVSQASFQPPLLMAAIRKQSNVFECLRESHAAAIHLVAWDQKDVAQKFFTPTKVENGCMNVEPFRLGRTSAPILENAPAYVECRVRRIYEEVGDHAIVILEVIEAECLHSVRPLTIAESPWEYGG